MTAMPTKTASQTSLGPERISRDLEGQASFPVSCHPAPGFATELELATAYDCSRMTVNELSELSPRPT